MTLLDLWLSGTRTAVLDDTAGFGLASLTYTPEAIERWGVGAIALSVRMPVREARYPGQYCRTWLDGLLPEAGLRRAVAQRFRVEESNTFRLLEQIGRECAGAVVIVEHGDAPPASGGVEWLGPEDLEDVIDRLDTAPFAMTEDSQVRVSLGGVQEKVVLVQDDDGRLGLPLQATPTTHILKPSPLRASGAEQWPGVAVAELLALRVLGHAGIPAAEAQVCRIGDRSALLVHRYDRVTGVDGPERLHQEDLCQALGLDPGEKYQSATNPFAPSFERIAGVLRDHAAAPLIELGRLHEQMLASIVLGNCDLHAKNLSLLIGDRDEDGVVRLAPAYDVVPTSAYPDVTTRLSLRVGQAWHLEDVEASDLDTEVAQWRVGPRARQALRTSTFERLRSALESAAAEVADEVGEHPVIDRVVAESTARIDRLG